MLGKIIYRIALENCVDTIEPFNYFVMDSQESTKGLERASFKLSCQANL
jgi:hypothetical protein